jgi:hypothetical protein
MALRMPESDHKAELCRETEATTDGWRAWEDTSLSTIYRRGSGHTIATTQDDDLQVAYLMPASDC